MVETRASRRMVVLLLLAAFLVLLLGRWLKPVDDAALMFSAPFAAVISGAAGAAGDTVSSMVDGPGLRADNARLRHELGILLRRNLIYQQEAHENAILKSMLRFDDLNGHMDLLPAMVIASNPTGVDPNIIIDRGSQSGLRTGMTVLSADGYFVGRIFDVAANAARVRLMLSPSLSVGAVDAETGAQGLVEGQFGARPQLDDVQTSSQVRVGDFIVTNGSYNLFPRNILLGQVTAVRSANYKLFQQVELEPAADFANLESVQVVRNWIPNLPAKYLPPK